MKCTNPECVMGRRINSDDKDMFMEDCPTCQGTGQALAAIGRVS